MLIRDISTKRADLLLCDNDNIHYRYDRDIIIDVIVKITYTVNKLYVIFNAIISELDKRSQF